MEVDILQQVSDYELELLKIIWTGNDNRAMYAEIVDALEKRDCHGWLIPSPYYPFYNLDDGLGISMNRSNMPMETPYCGRQEEM